MRAYFVDTWYFVAFLDRFDSHHRQALRIEREVRGADLFTHQHVLSEVLSYFADAGHDARQRGAGAVRWALRDMKVVTPDFHRALDLYEARPDKAYSLVDCMSMLVMKAHGITHVLTNDRHFAQEGFTLLNA
jgi:predicted nucleic acid-binding protein